MNENIYTYSSSQIEAGRVGLSLHEETYIQVAQVPDSNRTAVAYISRSKVLSKFRLKVE